MILADLAEGTFPAREAVEAFLAIRPGAPPDAASRRAFSREMLRFLRVIGSAESSVALIYPTTDIKGQDLLRAGFLDELMECLAPEALAACHRSVRRLDPALVDSPELAGSPGERRVRAVAMARTRGEPAALAELLRHAGHRRALDGTAAALQVLAHRLRGTPFGEYDGLLKDGDVVLDVADAFPSDYPFSASQLETYIACPFQFFCKYVLKLEPDERRDEIDEDYTERGSKIHDMLQRLEEMKRDSREAWDLEELERAVLDEVVREEPLDASEVDLGLREIDRRRLIQTIQRYRIQHQKYEDDPSGRPVPHRFEVTFGEENSVRSFPFLEIGRGARVVRLQGKIDRIDIVEDAGGRGFRVIDYKSGQGPSPNEVRQARLLQLPLYAMAVERIILAGEDVTLHDVGYWALRKEGYKAIAFSEWELVQAALESYVAELVDRLRRGVFVVDSQVDGCEGFCDFRAICRIRQARLAAKHHDRPTPPELATDRRRGRRVHLGGRRLVSTTVPPSSGVTLTEQQLRALGVPDASVALSAGAGCGKTMVLTERFLAALDDADGRPLEALVALTFTEKAARELRQRIRARCRARLTAGDDRDPERWWAVLRGLDAAPIGTFHEFCARLLRRHALQAGVDPEFAILDESIAGSLRDEAVRIALRKLLAARDADLIELGTDYGLRQVRESLGRLAMLRGAVGLEDWARQEPGAIAERWSTLAVERLWPIVLDRVRPLVAHRPPAARAARLGRHQDPRSPRRAPGSAPHPRPRHAPLPGRSAR